MIRIEGHLLDGQSTERRPVALCVSSEGRAHFEGYEGLVFRVADAEISTRIGSSARFIYLISGASFETLDNPKVDQIQREFSTSFLSGLAHTLESKKRFIIGSVVATMAVTFSLLWWGIPLASRHIAKVLPAEFSTQLASGAMKSLDKDYFSPSQLPEERQTQIQQYFNEALPENSEYQYRQHIRAGNELGANAFALPNGYIVMTDELIELANTDEEIIGVLYHEVGHVEHRHSLRRIIEASGIAITFAWFFGDVEMATDWVTLAPIFALGSMYSREHEREADGYALTLMQKNNYDTEHFANMMQSLMDSHTSDKCEPTAQNSSIGQTPSVEQNPNVEQNPTLQASVGDTAENKPVGNEDDCDNSMAAWLKFLSSHPPSEERIERFRRGE